MPAFPGAETPPTPATRRATDSPSTALLRVYSASANTTASPAPASASHRQPPIPTSFGSLPGIDFGRLTSVFGSLVPEPATLGPPMAHARNDSSAPSASASPSTSPPSSSSTPSAPSTSTPSTPGRSSGSSHAAALENEPEPPSTADITKAVDAMFKAYKLNAPAARHAMEQQAIPEKCFTWCSQRNDGNAMCRMMCLRRRSPLPTREETLARLRPAANTNSAQIGTANGLPQPPPPLGSSVPEGLGFFGNLRHRLVPYSIIFVKGTPEGVVGRYMEELEGDDGQYDFGPLSRHAPHTLRRKSTGHVEWFDWGESGYLLHVPLTSLFSPLLNLPDNAERVLGPPVRFVNNYINTFTDGTQERALQRLMDEVHGGGAVAMLGKIGDHYWKKLAETREREREARARAEEAVHAANSPSTAAQNVKASAVVNKDKNGGKGE